MILNGSLCMNSLLRGISADNTQEIRDVVRTRSVLFATPFLILLLLS